MRISEVELVNFRQYRGIVKVELMYDEKLNINIIQGVNGAGKTNFLNAINWCLYGEEENLEKYAGKKQPITNDAELNKLTTGDSITTKVTIKMVDESDRLYVFERSIVGRKDKSGKPKYSPSNLNIFVQIGRDMQLINEPDFMLNRILPKAVKNFFIFDGEKLDDFFKVENASQIRDSIYDVSQLTLLDSGIEHLEKTISGMRSKIKGQTPKIDEINEKIKAIEGGLDYSRTQLKEKDDELAQIQKELSEISDVLINSNHSVIKELEKQRESLDHRIDELDIDMDRKKNIAIKNVVNNGPKILALQSIYFTLDEIEDKTQKGEIPPKIKETFIKELLERGVCICGNDISKQGVARKNVQSLINEIALSAISTDLIDLKYDLNNTLNEVESFIENQNELRKEIRALEEKRQDLRIEHRNIDTRLKNLGTDEIDINNIVISRTKLETKRNNVQKDVWRFENNIELAKKELEQYRRDLNRELKKDEKHREVSQQLELGNDVYRLLTEVRQKLIDDIRNTIQQKTKEYFLKLIWKKDTYADVIIDDYYNISVINRVGSECLGSLSAGERQVLALSFLAALREVSGFDAPVIIDTPLGRISKEPRENIADLLPSFLSGTQVTMLMTDEEYTEVVRSKLSSNIITEYELQFNELESSTMVVEYGQS